MIRKFYFKHLTLIIVLFINSSTLFGQLTNIDSLEISIDKIVQEGLTKKAFPGTQVLIAKDGITLLSKSYGFHTYDSIRQVKNGDLYDLASITKVSSGLPILMKLFGEGKIDLNDRLVKYAPWFEGSNKSNLEIREILAHQAGLEPYIIYWLKTLNKNGKFYRKTFKKNGNKRFTIKITDQLFLHRKYKERMMGYIKDSPVEKNPKYKYSGLFFQILPDIIEAITGENFEEYLQDEIFNPIGINKMVYQPANKFPASQIIPTEYDSLFRKQLVHGTVHDEAAAMLDGISCNAGLFSNAEDLAKLFQLYLDDGVYEGKTIIDSAAIYEFTKCQYCKTGNRRGLGFDKPLIEYIAGKSHVAEAASPDSYGHSGFTGTFVWADPESDILVIFLSNRVYPSRKNRELYRLDIRPRIQTEVYRYLEN